MTRNAGGTSFRDAFTGNVFSGTMFRGPGPRGWFIGAGLSILLWAWPTWNIVWSVDEPLAWKVAASASLSVFFAAYAFLPRISWRLGVRAGIVSVCILLALNGVIIFFIGRDAMWTWTFLACAIAMTSLPPRTDFFLIVTLSLASLSTQLVTGNAEQALLQSGIILSLGLMMSAFARLIRQTARLREAQTELADAAVAAERSRVARDMHDILGHSLTVIAVKAELAGRMLDTVPGDYPARDLSLIHI